MLRILALAAKLSWDFGHIESAGLCIIAGLEVLVSLTSGDGNTPGFHSPMRQSAEHATKLFDTVVFLSRYLGHPALMNLAISIVARLHTHYRPSAFALCEHAVNQATMNLHERKIDGHLLTVSQIVYSALAPGAAHEAVPTDQNQDPDTAVGRSLAAAPSSVDPNNSLWGPSLSLDSHVALWVKAKILCGDGFVMNGGLKEAVNEYFTVYKIAGRQGIASPLLRSTMRMSFLYMLTQSSSKIQHSFEVMCRLIPTLGEMFELRTGELGRAWDVLNMAQPFKSPLRTRHSRPMATASASGAVEGNGNGVDDTSDDKRAEAVFFEDSEHQINVTDIKCCLAFACHALVSSRAHNWYGRFSAGRQLLQTLQHKFELGVFTEEEAKHMARTAGIDADVDLDEIFKTDDSPLARGASANRINCRWSLSPDNNNDLTETLSVDDETISLSIAELASRPLPSVFQTDNSEESPADAPTPATDTFLFGTPTPKAADGAKLRRPRSKSSASWTGQHLLGAGANVDRSFSFASLLNVLKMFSASSCDSDPRLLFGYVWILDVSLALLENFLMHQLRLAVKAAHSIRTGSAGEPPCSCLACVPKKKSEAPTSDFSAVFEKSVTPTSAGVTPKRGGRGGKVNDGEEGSSAASGGGDSHAKNLLQDFLESTARSNRIREARKQEQKNKKKKKGLGGLIIGTPTLNKYVPSLLSFVGISVFLCLGVVSPLLVQ